MKTTEIILMVTSVTFFILFVIAHVRYLQVKKYLITLYKMLEDEL